MAHCISSIVPFTFEDLSLLQCSHPGLALVPSFGSSIECGKLYCAGVEFRRLDIDGLGDRFLGVSIRENQVRIGVRNGDVEEVDVDAVLRRLLLSRCLQALFFEQPPDDLAS